MNKIEVEYLFSEAGVNKLPENWQRAIKRVYRSYPKDCLPQGLCDPVYICNTIALELGIGDGQGNFYNLTTTDES